MAFDDDSLDIAFLLGKDIHLNGIGVLECKKINDLHDVGFENYNKYLSCLCITSDDIYELFEWNDEFQNIDPYDFILANALYNQEYFDNVVNGLSFFLQEEFKFNEGGFFESVTKNSINKSNFNFFIDILRKQNCVNQESKKMTPKNEAQKKMFIKLKKARAKYNKQDNNVIDIISSVCAKHPSISLFNVGELSMYQLIDQYKRLNAIDEYFISINSLMHGASNDDIKVKHWSSKQRI